MSKINCLIYGEIDNMRIVLGSARQTPAETRQLLENRIANLEAFETERCAQVENYEYEYAVHTGDTYIYDLNEHPYNRTFHVTICGYTFLVEGRIERADYSAGIMTDSFLIDSLTPVSGLAHISDKAIRAATKIVEGKDDVNAMMIDKIYWETDRDSWFDNHYDNYIENREEET